MVSDRFSAYNHLLVMQRHLCWAHLIRDLIAIAERQGVSGKIGLELLALQQQLFVQWHQWKDGAIDWPSVAETYTGIEICPYRRSQRMRDDARWYYTWDVASGCVWDPAAVREIVPVAL